MQAEHVQLAADGDRVVIAVQMFIALAVVVGAYVTLKLGRGWWPPHRPRR